MQIQFIISMKRSNNVILSAIFLTAIASATARAQQVHTVDTSKMSEGEVDSSNIVSYNDSDAFYDNNKVVNRELPPPSYGGFFRFGWVFNWRGYHHYRHYHHMHPARAQTYEPRVVSQGGSFKTTTPMAINGTRSNGFGNTMHTSHSSAHS